MTVLVSGAPQAVSAGGAGRSVVRAVPVVAAAARLRPAAMRRRRRLLGVLGARCLPWLTSGSLRFSVVCGDDNGAPALYSYHPTLLRIPLLCRPVLAVDAAGALGGWGCTSVRGRPTGMLS